MGRDVGDDGTGDDAEDGDGGPYFVIPARRRAAAYESFLWCSPNWHLDGSREAGDNSGGGTRKAPFCHFADLLLPSITYPVPPPCIQVMRKIRGMSGGQTIVGDCR